MVTFDFRMQTAYSTATSHFRNGSRNLCALWFFPPKRGWPHANVRIQLQSLDLARRSCDVAAHPAGFRGFLPVSVQTIAVRRLCLA
jgi:hypothetical protein